MGYITRKTEDLKPLDFASCNCAKCDKKCVHNNAYRRLPEVIGGLGLCENLEYENEMKHGKRLPGYKFDDSGAEYHEYEDGYRVYTREEG